MSFSNVTEGRLMLIEDDPGLRFTLSDRLEAEGYDVVCYAEGQQAIAALPTQRPHLIVLDVMLPDTSGLDICRSLRAARDTTPILMLTALRSVDDRVAGLKSGADDYLYKPFETAELLARIEALLRRHPPSRSEVAVGQALVDWRARTIHRDGELMELSARAFDLLHYLFDHAGESIGRETLLRDVWGMQATTAVDTRTVDVHVAMLRRVVEPDPQHPRHIVTVRRVGYRLDR